MAKHTGIDKVNGTSVLFRLYLSINLERSKNGACRLTADALQNHPQGKRRIHFHRIENADASSVHMLALPKWSGATRIRVRANFTLEASLQASILGSNTLSTHEDAHLTASFERCDKCGHHAAGYECGASHSSHAP